MNLTTKGRYAVTAMLDLALHYNEGPISLAAITNRQDISLSYLEQLFAKLRKTGLVVSSRGPGGGYRLNKEPHDITVAEIIDAVDEKVDATRCAGEGMCQKNEQCLTHDLWSALTDQIHDFLDDVNLGTMLENKNVQCVAERQLLKQMQMQS